MSKHLQAVSYVIGGDVTAHCVQIIEADGATLSAPFNVTPLSQDDLREIAKRAGRDTWSDEDVADLAGVLPTPAPQKSVA